VGLALPVRRQRGTGHRGGAVLVLAAPHAEIDINAPSARCAAAHCGVLMTLADRAAGAQCPLYSSSVALPVAVSAVPLFSHLGAELGPFLLNAGRAASVPARPWRTPACGASVAGCRPRTRCGRTHRRRQGDVIASCRPCWYLRCLPHGHAVLLSCLVSSLRMRVSRPRSGRTQTPQRRTRRARRTPRARPRSRFCATRRPPCRPASALATSC